MIMRGTSLDNIKAFSLPDGRFAKLESGNVWSIGLP
jgi:hypothetical protein